MAGKTYMTKGYSTYTNIPSRQGDYDHGPKGPVNQYGVEPKTIERVRAPTSRGYKDFVGSPSKVELLKEYVHSPTMSGGPKYAPTNHYEDQVVNYTMSLKKNPFSSPVQGYHSDESSRIHPGSSLGGVRHVRTGEISSPNKSWQTAGPPATHHPLTTSTNSINEALGFLEDSVYYSPRADPRRRGVLDDLSTRAQPLEPQSRYARPAFVAKLNDNRHNFTNRYRGSLVP